MRYREAVEVDRQVEIALVPGYLSKNQVLELEQFLESVFRILSKMITNSETH